MAALASNSERAHHTIGPLTPALPECGVEKYYRFNVGWKTKEVNEVQIVKHQVLKGDSWNVTVEKKKSTHIAENYSEKVK